MNETIIRLRPHHALCLRHFAGKGYSDAFVANMAALHRRLGENPDHPVQIILHRDVLCEACPHDIDNICESEEKVRRITGLLDQPENEAEDHYSIGLSNVHQRIRILFGEPYGLTIESQSGVRTVVSIIMPARKKEELEEYVQSNHRG